jgi:Transposase DDE domain
MRLPVPFSTLAAELSTAFAAALTPGQQRGLAAWVAGTVVAGSSCEPLVGLVLEETLCIGTAAAIRERLREFVDDAVDHNAPGRAEVDPTACFAPLLTWVLSHGHGHQVALALDVTTHTDQLTAIVVSLLAHGRAIPVAWHLLAGNQPGAFIPPALELLQRLAPVLVGYEVSLAADRGLWSPPLADAVERQDWQPLLRVQCDVSIWLGRGQRVRADRLVAGPGHAWVGRVTVHKERARQRVQTVMVVWLEGYREPWVVFTTCPPSAAALLWYGLRAWIEAGFRDLKRLGWQWERTRRRNLVRVSRHWLVLAVATTWALAHGLPLPAATAPAVPDPWPPNPRRPPAVSAFQRGRFRLLGMLLGHHATLVPRLVPAPWPAPARDAPHLAITHGPLVPPPHHARAPAVNLPL